MEDLQRMHSDDETEESVFARIKSREKLSHIEPMKKDVVSCIVRSYAGFSLNGIGPNNTKKINQDALVMMEDPTTLALVFACFDGHGTHGHIIAQSLKRSIESNLLQHPSFTKKDFKTAISDTISIAELELLRDANVNTELSGATMVMVVVCNNMIVTANIGDSRAVLGRFGSHSQDIAVALSVDHKPSSPYEKFRIMSMGGRVFPIKYSDGVIGPDRVWLGQKNSPGLAMSRSLCDSVAHEAGVISTPDMVEMAVDMSQDRLLVLATDGLWDVMSNAEAVALCSTKTEPSSAVGALIREARSRWLSKSSCMDDTTICVVFLHGH